MLSLTYLSLLTLSVLTTALPHKWNSWQPKEAAQALYVMTNDVSANSIIAMSVGKDGMPSGGAMTATGGKGGNLVGKDGKPDFPDALSVQDSVVRAGEYLFAVNAGSNTVSMFAISPSDPADVQMLGQPQSSQGFFPVALAASSSMNTVCVANQGIPSGISCASFSSSGLSQFDALRPMDFGTKSNPPTGPTPGIGDLFFSVDETSLLVMVKGDGTPDGFSGFAGKFAVADGQVSREGSQTTPPSSGALFGTGFIPGSSSKILTSDASVGALILDIDDLSAAPIAITNVTGQKASCWARVSSVTGTGFITDAAVNRLVEVSVTDGSIVKEYYPDTGFQGMTDFSTVGSGLWTLSAGNGSYPASITTFDVGGGAGRVSVTGSYVIPGAGVNTMGMAVL